MESLNKTFLSMEKYENRNWFVIDCKDQKLGRLATIIVSLLQGKIKPYYYPSLDLGDYIILINANLIILNQNKKQFSVYNPGRPGKSLKKITNLLPALALKRTIKGMLSKSETRKYIKRFNIYANQEHPHEAQNPIKLNF